MTRWDYASVGLAMSLEASTRAGSAVRWISQRSSTGSEKDCPHGADSGMDLVVGFRLGMEMASGSSSGMDALTGSGTVVGGGSHTWSMAGIGSGSISMAGSGVTQRFAIEDFSCCPGHSGLDELCLEREYKH